MRNMSFTHTRLQIIHRTKTVTHRLGWENLKPGQRFQAVEKSMGLHKGEKVKRLAILECVSNRRVLLEDITDDDVAKEGFPVWTRADFLRLFYRNNPQLKRGQKISRIEFRYIEEET